MFSCYTNKREVSCAGAGFAGWHPQKLNKRNVVITNYEAHAVTEAMEPASLEVLPVVNGGAKYARIAALDGSWEIEGALMDEIIVVNGM